MELKLRYYGDPVLRERSATIETFDDELRELAEGMVDTMFRMKGIGLAAPQVGRSKRLIIALQMSDVEDETAEPVALVNPEVVERSSETWVYEEGCLSIPEVVGDVTRPDAITVRYQDLDGQALSVTTSGMFARIVLHEVDHLNGRLFIDYLSAANKSLIKPRLKEIAARYPSPSS